MAWIETTHVVAAHRTQWRVVLAGEVACKGEVADDPSGILAHDAALAWLTQQGHAFRGWTHAIDRTLPDGSGPAGRGTDKAASQPRALLAALRDAWIETTHHVAEDRTDWRVVVDGEVVHKGTEPGDRAGAMAYEIAHRWLGRTAFVLGGWTHAIDRAPGHRADALVYGWVQCPTGAREPVAVTAAQRDELARGSLPCPVCGEACGARLVAGEDGRHFALSWTGTRWHAVLAGRSGA